MLAMHFPYFIFAQQASDQTASKLFNDAYQAYIQKDFTGAVHLYSQAIALKSDYAEAYYNRGHAYFQL